jgi:hypothetical protein
MYKIIGTDGKEYGPIPADQLRQWIAESRVNAQTKVLPDGATGWKLLAEIPELAAALPVTPPPAPVLPAGFASVADQVQGPAIGLIVTGVLNILLSVARIILMATGFGLKALSSGGRSAEMDKLLVGVVGTAGIVVGIIGAIVGIFVLYGGVKMQKQENYGLCMTASIMAMIPCLSQCCLIGLPIGIWALVVLAKPEVKSAFR